MGNMKKPKKEKICNTLLSWGGNWEVDANGNDGWWPARDLGNSTGLTRIRASLYARAKARLLELTTGNIAEAAYDTSPIESLQVSGQHAQQSVVLVTGSLEAGGAERQCAITSVSLADLGVRVRLISRGSDQAPLTQQYYFTILENEGINLIDMHFQDPPENYSDISYMIPDTPSTIDNEIRKRCHALPLGIGNEVAIYYRLFRKMKPDVVHTWQDYTNTTAALAALWAGVPRVVLGLRNLNPTNFSLYQPFFRPIYRMLLQDSRITVTSNSKRTLNDYIRWIGIKPARSQVITNAYKDVFKGQHLVQAGDAVEAKREAILEPRVSSDRLRVLGVFRLYHEKDPLLFVKVAGEVAKAMPNVDFSIVGAGDMEGAVRAEITRQNLDGRFQLLGLRRDVLRYMRDADLLLHTARFEGMPNVLIEAQAMGLPIVTTDVGGIRETILQDKTAQVIKERHKGPLARAVVNCLGDKQWLETARLAGPEHIRQSFGIDTMMKSTLSAYGLNLKPLQEN